MAALVLTAWVGQLLRWLPRPLISRLDAWSLRKARESAALRRAKAQAKAPAAPQAQASYTPQPWRD
jgi:hypothetical protein